MQDKIWQRHTCLHVDDVLRLLGLEGEARRMWIEEGADYLHIITQWREPGDPPEGFLSTTRRGYCEITPYTTEECRVVDP